MTRQLLTAKGFPTRLRTGFSSPGIRIEQEAGLVDLYWEYTGTALSVFNNITGTLGAEEGYERVKALDGKKGLIWLRPSKVNNTYVLAMRKADADAKGIASISDFATRSRQGERFRIAVNTEFYIRTDGLLPLQQAYRFALPSADILRTETGLIYGLCRTTGPLTSDWSSRRMVG